MAITIQPCVQIRIRDDAPWYVRNCVPFIAGRFMEDASLFMLSTYAGYGNDKDGNFVNVITADSDVRVRVLKQMELPLVKTRIYEAYTTNSKYTCIFHNSYGVHNIKDDIDPKAVLEHLSSSPEMKSEIKKISDQVETMENSVDDAPIFTWLSEVDQNKLSKSMVTEYILQRVVPSFTLSSKRLSKQDQVLMFRSLLKSTYEFIGWVGYKKAKPFLTTEFLPVPQNVQSIRVLHINCYEKVKDSVLGIFYGVQVDETYYYAGDFVRVALCDNPSLEWSVEKDKEMMRWVDNKIDKYVKSLVVEGMSAVGVHVGHFNVSSMQ